MQVYSNKGPHPFPRRDNTEIVKRRNSKIFFFFFRTTGLFSTKPNTKQPYVRWTETFSSHNQGYGICIGVRKCVF